MLLVLDVGNTNISVGVYEQDTLKFHWRINTDKQKTEDEFGMLIREFLKEEGVAPKLVKGIIISSVVPALMFSLEKMCHKYFHQEPIIVTSELKTGLTFKMDKPSEVGADRIVNAVAALDQFKPPFIIIDFGTATTFCYVDGQGRYRGGAIAPGIQISTDALYHHAAKLPRIELKKPAQVIGNNTIDAMQSGIIYGYVGQVDYIISKMITEASLEYSPKNSTVKPFVIATGGLSKIIKELSEHIEHLDPFLTLKGLLKLYEMNKK